MTVELGLAIALAVALTARNAYLHGARREAERRLRDLEIGAEEALAAMEEAQGRPSPSARELSLVLARFHLLVGLGRDRGE